MALQRPVFVGKSDILDGFTSMNPDGDYLYSVWYGDKDIAFQCIQQGYDSQYKMLEDNLTRLESAGNTDVLQLKFHPGETDGYITLKTAVVSKFPFQVCAYQDIKVITGETGGARPAGLSLEAWEVLKSLKDLPATIDAKINERFAQLEAEEIDDEPEESTAEKTIGIIKGITQDPEIMKFIGQVVGYLKGAPAPQPARIGMVEPQPQQQATVADQAPQAPQRIEFSEDLMNESLNRLSFHCNVGTDLKLLADLAEQKPVYFNMLLNQLRS